MAIIRVPSAAFSPHKWHLHILKAFDDKVARFFILVWHRRARKTTLILNILIKEAIKNPKSMYAYVAPCYDEQTEILTDNGWKYFKDLQDEKVAILDKDELKYEKPEEKFVYPYIGELIGIKHLMVDMLVTPNHRCLVKEYDGVIAKEAGWHIKTAEEIYGSYKYMFKKNCEWNGNDEGDENWCEFLGFWFAEGSARLRTHQPNNGRIKIKNKKGKEWCVNGEVVISQKWYLDYTEDLLNRNNIKFSKCHKKDGNYNYYIYDTKLAKQLVPYGKAVDKRIPDFIKNASTRLINKFLYGYFKGDGHFSKGLGDSTRCFTASKQLADDIQELVIKTGKSANLNYAGGQYRITVLHKKNNESRIDRKHWYKTAYKGFVYCVKVNSGIVLVRRNGKQYFCGNTYVQAKNITWRDPNMLERYLPKELVRRKNESELYVEFTNGSILKILGADKPDALRGSDWCGFGLDEFALMKREIWEEILRPILAQHKDRWAIFAFTPKGVNYAHELWVKSQEWEGWMRSLLKGSESQLLEEDQLRQAKIEMTDALYNQEIECSFISREEKSMITSEMIDALESNTIFWEEEKSVVACDPSEGGDECVIHAIHNTQILETIKLHENDSMVIAGHMISLAYKHGIKDFAVDNIGIGKGIEDRLREQGHNIIGIRSSEKAFDEKHFYNKRTEMWWYVAETIRNKLCEPIKDFELKGQLVAPKYEVVDSSGKIRLEPKKYTKDILGRSPDNADAFVYGIWALHLLSDKQREVGRPAYKAQQLKYAPSVLKQRRFAHA